MQFTIRATTPEDKPVVEEIISHWLTNFIISRGRRLYPAELPGFLAFDETGKPIGLLTMEIVGDECEVVTLDAFVPWSGIGTELMKRAEQAARDADCRRLWLITTNDNIEALGFYQKRGFSLVALRPGAIEYSRKLKPAIPETGAHGIPIRDELELEVLL